jgi:hypothetical protein
VGLCQHPGIEADRSGSYHSFCCGIGRDDCVYFRRGFSSVSTLGLGSSTGLLSLLQLAGFVLPSLVLFESQSLPNASQSLKRERNILIVGARTPARWWAREMQKNRQLNRIVDF